ncbi:TPR-like protein [Westerdykella ornata]|uniref:TPR-like protein n=1 Tax=Westerdykella ornata TaxID=318751 RepID=A0A6A6JEA1_WESOR|nr:TPR-like protein [Westerdykella ornata]KAF2274940.1 TPR-like protein [Westerdykella ornata]
MVLPSLFGKSSKKSSSSSSSSPSKNPPETPSLHPGSPSQHNNPGTPPSSPDKKSHNRLKDRDRRSSSYSSRRSSKYDRDSHPLNLPPDELRRLSSSAMSQMNNHDQATPEPMDIDRETTTSPSNTKTTPNGTAATNGDYQDARPAPPPHRYTTSPPPQSANYAATPEAASPPAQAPTIDAESYKAAGNKFFKIKDYAQAIKEYTKAIEADPKNATYYSNRAAALMSANRFVEALEDCKTADELEPGNMKILLRLGRLYTSLGRPDEALAVFDSIDPPCTAKDKQPALNMKKHLQQAQEICANGGAGSMVIHALNEAEKGLGVGVERPRKWMLLRGEAHLKMGNMNALGEAQNVAMSLLRSNSQDPEALVLRGRALYGQGENEKAIQHFRQALNCDPDFKDAVKYLRMVQKLDRTKEAGNAAFKAGRYQEAIDTYTTALEIDPSNKNTNSKILQNRALCHTRLQNWTQAIADCDKALELDPGYTKARKTRAKALGESGNWEEAVREYKAIQEANPSEPGIAKEIRNAELELKKSKRKDYYKILGISKDATEQDIKKAYRKLAIVHHPDKNPDDDQAAERFKEIQEANETLSDPQKRARYDSGEDLIDPSEMFSGGGFGGMGGMGGGVQIDPEMLFNMFGGMGGGGMGGGRPGGGGFSFSTGGGHPFGGMGGMGGMPGGAGGRQYQGGFPF